MLQWFCVAALCAGAASARAGADETPQPVQVASGVYMFRGAAGEVDPANLGRVGNAGFIVGETGVVVVDTGTSYRHGVALLQAIARVTDKPVKLALITHTRQEFLFGGAAFQERGIPLHMHAEAAGLMTARCETCLKTLRRVLGDDAMQGTAMFRPDQTFESSHTIDAALIGRELQVLYHGHSAGPGDVALLDPASGVLFAGGLLDHERIPDVQDSDPKGWASALAAWKRLPLKTIVPGHGGAASPAAIDTELRYLEQLQVRLRELLRKDTALSEVADATRLTEFEDWDQYDTIHRRNASVWFLRFEREAWTQPQQ